MALDFTKPTAALHKLSPALARERWTNKVSLLSPGVTIGYRDRGPGVLYPDADQRSAIIAGASAARRIMRKAVSEMDRVVFARRNEGQAFTNIMNYHFGLAGNRANIVPKTNVVDKSFAIRDLAACDRRWALNKIREGMLSLSFHINTGVYLIDNDNDFRTLKSGGAGTSAVTYDPTTGDLDSFEEGYLTWAGAAGLDRGLLAGFRNGEIHVAFRLMADYGPEHYARVIIHEAAHKFLGVDDKKYAHQGGYANLSFKECLDNADSFAWAALSLDAGGLMMGTYSTDPTITPGPIA
jgi:hypothetical protein